MNVFIADDSILIRNIVEEILSSDPQISIVGKAANGADAVTRALALQPDIIIMDLDMPVMNGLEACSRIVEASSIPVLIFSHNTDPELPFKALELGAVDFLLKPDFNDLNKPEYMKNFIEKLIILSNRRVIKPKKSFSATIPADRPVNPLLYDEEAPVGDTDAPSAGIPDFPSGHPKVTMLVVGASTGGPQAVTVLLSGLPIPFELPITLVQHIETGFDQGYADWLADETGHTVLLAKNGMMPEAGKVYVAPTDIHLKFWEGTFILDNGMKVLNQKPSVDVLFRSAAEAFGPKALAVLLTGMGTDGADGCAAIQTKGGFTIVQDEATSLIFGMPKAAIARGAASIVLPLEKIAPFITQEYGQKQ
jgi:two-component system chemotaxis response regulator CheB